MSLAQSLLPEFDREMALTRKHLERVPEDRFGWKPHEKSFTMLGLASHLTQFPTWLSGMLTTDCLDIAPVGKEPYKVPEFKTRAEIVDALVRGVAAAREALETTTDEQMQQEWSLLSGGKPVFTMPRTEIFRGMIMNHMIHHRAQLGVYLRLCDIPVPSTYGPSADEQ